MSRDLVPAEQTGPAGAGPAGATAANASPGVASLAGASPAGATAAEARLRALHDRLLTAVQEVTSEKGWQQMLRTAAALPTYSPHNVLLIASQRPDARAVAGFHTWKQLGRAVRKGEKGIAILAPVVRRTTDQQPPSERHESGKAAAGSEASRSPITGPDLAGSPVASRRVAGFRVVHVFDISQTDGPDLPEPPQAIRLAGAAPDGLVAGLTAQIRVQGFQLLRRDIEIAHPGMAGANGVTDFLARTVVLRPDLSGAQTAKTLAHELGHVLLHRPGVRPAGLSREQAEVEAESVAYVVTAAHGLDSSTYTVPYVAGWAGADQTLVGRTAERVLGTARDVLRHLPPPATLLLAEATRDRLRETARVAPPERTVRRAPLPAATLEDPRRPITPARPCSRPPGQDPFGPGSAERPSADTRSAEQGRWP
ncbi:MAG: ImmA/IrrE family metallo-endopeptidase [Frankiales bacterium]|jgi:DNA primase|nr:ImmA/IrrE family metallo-endopeptidase [Frankiales bacterium]